MSSNSRPGARTGRTRHVNGKTRSNVVQYEVLLQEMLGAAGVLGLPQHKRDERRLACHMTLFRELVATHAFGPLQPIMTSILDEVTSCLYTDAVCATDVPQILKMWPGAEKEIHRIPFFVQGENIKKELRDSIASGKCNRERSQKAEAFQKELQQKFLSTKAREDQLNTDMQVFSKQKNLLQSELGIVKERAESLQEKHEEELRMMNEKCENLQVAADRAKLELAFIKSQRNEDKSLQEAFVGLHATTQAPKRKDKTSSLNTLHDQLLVLMHVRIDDFESNLVEACDAFEEERLRDQFIAEVSLVDKEIISLRAFMEKTKAELEQVNYDGSAARVRSNAVLIKDDGATNPDRGSKFLFPDELVTKTREDEAATTDGIVNQAEPLWRDFLQRCDHAFHLPRGARVVGKEKLLKLVEDVLRAKHERNLAALETEPTSDFFYNFIHDTYGVPHAAMLVIHGILTALIQFREEHPILAMFSAILTGSLDEAAWEYSMHWRELLKQFPVGSMHELQHYVLQLYPGFSDQETSEFINEFHTTSVICTSDSLIAHLTDKLLQRSEMRLRKWMRVLRWRDAQHSGGLRKLEFNGLVQEFFGSASEELVAFYCSNLTSKHGNSRVPLEGWAFVCCCLEVFQKSPRSMDF